MKAGAKFAPQNYLVMPEGWPEIGKFQGLINNDRRFVNINGTDMPILFSINWGEQISFSLLSKIVSHYSIIAKATRKKAFFEELKPFRFVNPEHGETWYKKAK